MKLKISKKLSFGFLLLYLILYSFYINFSLPSEPQNTPIAGASGEIAGWNEASESAEVFVTRVIDGDTFEIQNGKKVRMIGIDTPETNHPKKKVECFGKEATENAQSVLLGKKIRLEKDVSETDRYGRLLRYVYIESEFINELFVKEGYAYAASFPPDIKYQGQLKSAQIEAEKQQKGLWGATCLK